MKNECRRLLTSGVPSLDVILGGGIPEGDLLVVVGPPGSGKTTLTFQIASHVAASGQVIYVSALSEPASRLLKHIRTFSFWDESCVGKRVFLESMYPLVKQGLEKVVDALRETVRAHSARLLILDGFVTIRDLHPEAAELRTFINDLAVELAPLNCTTIVTTSEIPDMHRTTPFEFTMCDGILELGQYDVGSTTRRLLRAWKMRGTAILLGSHAYHISADGIVVYPRVESQPLPNATRFEAERLSTGLPELDGMMSGGLPRASSTILAGAPGTGKTLLALHYLIAGAQRGEKGLFVGFRESDKQLLEKAHSFQLDLEPLLARGLIAIDRRAPFNLDFDQVMSETWTRMERVGAQRLVIDSVVELEETIVEPLRRRNVMAYLTESLRARGVTAILTRQIGQVVGPELDFTNSPLSVLGENVVLLRYVEFESQLARIISVLNMRDAQHEHSIRQYEITGNGLYVRSQRETAEGLLSGIAKLPSEARVKRYSSGGSSDQEEAQ